jgi:hypothetical protein
MISTNGYANLSPEIALHNRLASTVSSNPDLTVNQISARGDVRITVSSETKLSGLQRFILKAAYANKVNKAMLPAPWSRGPWRDLTDEEVALLYYDLGEYAPARMEDEPPVQIGGFTFPGKPAGFSRQVYNRKVSRSVKGVARAAISRAMKRLAARGLIKRFAQNHAERVFYASCNLTAQGCLLAERLTNALTVIYLPNGS